MENRKKILEMIQRHEISSEQGMKLLQVEEPQQMGENEKYWKNKCIAYFKNIISKVTKIPVKSIHAKESFDRYGLDSVVIVSLNEELEKHFGEIPKTIFFEYRTVQDLTEYFIDNYEEILLKEIGEKKENNESTRAIVEIPVEPKDYTGKRFLATNESNGKKNIEYSETDIAIIGLNGMFPLAKNIDEFWSNLEMGRDCITEIPKERFDYQKYYVKDKDEFGCIRSKWGGFMENMDEFDPLFFNISPREANYMDPQERLFLKTVWNTMEDAGYTKDSLTNKKVGVFAGVWYGEYQMIDGEEQGRKIVHTSSYSSVANRVSYFFDFHGPCMAVDTMCSSSITSIHLACDSLRKGESDFAIAGGVNVSGIVPHKYLFLSQGKFLSTDGKCRAFGEGGTGYVPGEGVGALLLKPLSKAIKDRDNIYAVIKGSAINHGGRTNGFSVPNPVAQGDIIYETLQQAHINPETIGYVEAHGTGTALGDPIEIKGLMNAFQKYTDKQQFCAIGSVKSNIGHLESAAGIAGIIKVLLQMKHHKLVPSVHTEVLNSNIQFKDTPFKVQRKLETWEKQSVVENGIVKTYPRRAGISAFGAGGSNAHLLIEDYEEMFVVPCEEKTQMIVLSARNDVQLKAVAKQLLDFVSEKNVEDTVLSNLAYTLQAGREAMKERVAFLITGVHELEEKLTSYVNGTWEKTLWWDKEHLECDWKEEVIDDGEVDAEYLITLRKEKAYATICNLWVSGVMVSWDLLYQDGEHPRRISLPTYPFEEKRYWVPRTKPNDVSIDCNDGCEKLHPMIDRNESTLFYQCYEKTFSTKDFYVKDHIIDGKNVLPGVAYLEMARAAGELANGIEKVVGLRNIIWVNPIIIPESNMEAFIHFEVKSKGVAFDISTLQQGNQKVVHASGTIVYSDSSIQSEAIEKPLDIESIQKRCKIQRSKKEFYEKFSKSAFQLGSTLESIQMIYCNEQEALSYLVLPVEAEEHFSSMKLNPSLMDGALQTFLGLAEYMDSKPGTVYLPFTVDEVEIIKPLQKECYAYFVTKNQTSEIRKYDVVITDMQGNVLVRLKNYSVREMKQATESKEEKREQNFEEIVYYENVLVAKEMQNDVSAQNGDLLIFAKEDDIKRFKKELVSFVGKVIFIKQGNEFQKISEELYEIGSEETDYICLADELIQRKLEPVNIIYTWGNEETSDIMQALSRSVYSLFYLTKAIMVNMKLQHKIRLVFSYSKKNETSDLLYRALDGFTKSVLRENPNYFYKVVELDTQSNMEKTLLKELMNKDDFVYYKNENRFVRELSELKKDNLSKHNQLREGGVYLITGGMGAIGQIFANYLSKEYHAKLILVGRSCLNEEILEKIAVLEKNGSKVCYLSGDVSKKDDVERIVAEGVHIFGAIDGVIHAAGLIKDSFVLKKKKDEMDTVLGPKVLGTIYLQQALSNQKLEVFIMCSSISSVMGNAGQCDYAFANSFMDAFATSMEHKNPACKVISINWPLWEDGGMTINQPIMELMKKKMGIVPISTHLGLEALETCLQLNKSQCIVFSGNQRQIRELFSQKPEKSKNDKTAVNLDGEEYQDLKEKMNKYLKHILSNEIQLEADLIDNYEKFENYGIDSVMVMNLSKQLEQDFNELPKTLFFEYSCIEELSEYFIKEHFEETVNALGFKKPNEYVEETNLLGEAEENRRKIQYRFSPEKEEAISQEDDIAIIGLGLKYPKANDEDEFWYNLKTGRDCITEIPKERWDYQEYYHPDKNNPGTIYSKWGGFMDDIDKFDPLFFKIAAREAEFMDPQERIFLEVAYHTMEDSGYTRETLSKKQVGVYVGVWFGEYQLLEGESEGVKVAHTSSYASIANRVSYCFDFHGPSIAVDTMCSSSVVAIHLACESLRSGDIDVAIAGGVNISGIHPDKYLLLCQGNFVSSDGKCKSFGDGGDGYVPGEGAGAVMLKPLRKAKQDGDHIYGIIKASALNHGGKTSGYSVPNPNAQAEVIERTLEKAKINPRTIGYIEAHGTGTALGDPIEIQGLTKAFKKYTNDRQFCSIGSVKSNIGHLESAAGIAGITKVLLQMKYKKLVPSLHTETLNSNINFELTPFYVQKKYTDWNRPVVFENGIEQTYKRRAGISSFGAGGANAHIILEEYEDDVQNGKITLNKDKREYLILLSAWNEERLMDNASRILKYIEAHESLGKNEEKIQSRRNDNKSVIIAGIKELLADLVQVDSEEIDIREPIAEYITDAVILTSFLTKLNEKYQLELPLMIFNENTSIESLSSSIWCESREIGQVEYQEQLFLSDLEYSLQTAKEEMFARISFVVSDLQELINKLHRYCQGDKEIERSYCGNTRNRLENKEWQIREKLNDVSTDDLLASNNLEMLAKLWVSGTKIDWLQLYPDKQSVRRIKLPEYPFAKERYWGVEKPEKINKVVKSSELHPLVQRNTSSFRCVQFESNLLLCPNLFLENTVQNQKVIPASVFIEMVRVAAKMAGEEEVQRIEHMHFAGIFNIARCQEVTMHLIPSRNGARCEICCKDNSFVYTQAETSFRDNMEHKKGISSGLQHNQEDLFVLSNSQMVYCLLEQFKCHYGSAFQVIDQIHWNQKCATSEVLMKEEQIENAEVFLLEAMIQTAETVLYQNKMTEGLVQVYAIDGLEFYKVIGQKFEVYAELVQQDAAKGTFTLQVVMVDESKANCIVINNLVLRSLVSD